MTDSLFGSKRRSEDVWSKEAERARYQKLRQQLESGQLDGKPRPKPWPLTLLGVLLIVVAFGLGLAAFAQYTRVQQGGDWPSVGATLTSTSVRAIWDDDRNRYYYDVNGTYTYTVAGRNFAYDTRVDVETTQSGAESRARELKGQRMTLYFDPSHPEIALPFPGGSAFTVVLVVAAPLTLIAGIFFFMTGGQPLRRS